MSETVWVCETGEYEDAYVVGVFTAPQKAYEAVRASFDAPYKVAWGPLSKDGYGFEFVGQFARVPNYSTEHTRAYVLNPYPLDAIPGD